MAEKIEIREATDDDIEIIAALAKEIWNQHYTPLIGKDNVDYMLSQFQTSDAIAADIKSGFVYYIAFYDGEPCGYTSVSLNDGAFLSKLYLKQALRGKGVGRALFDSVAAFANHHDVKRIWLKCNKHNPTLEIYYTLGFKVSESVVSNFGEGCLMEDYVLEKIL